jgi:hypothetical protein
LRTALLVVVGGYCCCCCSWAQLRRKHKRRNACVWEKTNKYLSKESERK